MWGHRIARGPWMKRSNIFGPSNLSEAVQLMSHLFVSWAALGNSALDFVGEASPDSRGRDVRIGHDTLYDHAPRVSITGSLKSCQRACAAALSAGSCLARGLPTPTKLQAKMPRASGLVQLHHCSVLPRGGKQLLVIWRCFQDITSAYRPDCSTLREYVCYIGCRPHSIGGCASGKQNNWALVAFGQKNLRRTAPTGLGGDERAEISDEDTFILDKRPQAYEFSDQVELPGGVVQSEGSYGGKGATRLASINAARQAATVCTGASQTHEPSHTRGSVMIEGSAAPLVMKAYVPTDEGLVPLVGQEAWTAYSVSKEPGGNFLRASMLRPNFLAQCIGYQSLRRMGMSKINRLNAVRTRNTSL